jgi:hypothetical protein
MLARRKLTIEACVVTALLMTSAAAWAQYAPPQQMQPPQLPPSLPNNIGIAPLPPAPPMVPSAPIAAPAPSPAVPAPQPVARPDLAR